MSEIQRFRQDMDRLGNHPDKALINQLTYFAEVNKRTRAKDIVTLVSSAVLSPRMPSDRRLPLCYLMDSVLKNVEAPSPYPSLFGAHVKAMSRLTFETGTAKDRQNVKKLLRTWKERSIFELSLLQDLERWISDFERNEAAAPPPSSRPPDRERDRERDRDRDRDRGGGVGVGDKRRPPPSDGAAPTKRYHQAPDSLSRHSAPPPDPRTRPPQPSTHIPPPALPPVPITPPAPAPSAPTGTDFTAAVEQEMNSLLDQLRQDIGYAQRLTIAELRQMNPALADQLKSAAETAIASRFASAPQAPLGPTAVIGLGIMSKVDSDKARELVERLHKKVRDGTASGSGAHLLKAASMVANDLVSVLQAVRAAPPYVAPPTVPVEALNLFGPASTPYGLSVVPLPSYPPPPPGPPPHLPSTTPPASEDLGPFTSDNLNKRSAATTAMVTRLYSGERCPDCGRRLPSPRDLADHMDFHYQQNQEKLQQQDRKSRRHFATYLTWIAEGPWIGLMPVAQSSAVRDLMDSIGKGSGGQGSGKGGGSKSQKGGRKKKEKQESPRPTDSVPVDELHTKCKLCGEPFEQFWDDRESEFMFRNAVRVAVDESTGKLEVVRPKDTVQAGQMVVPVHKLCFQGATDHDAASKLLLRQNSSISVPVEGNGDGGGDDTEE